jgi:hypothetical protein
MIAPDSAGRRRRRTLSRVESQSLLDVVDNLIDKGVALDAEVVLGLADIDLVYLRAGALLAAADRVLPPKPGGRRRRRAATRATMSASRRSVPPDPVGRIVETQIAPAGSSRAVSTRADTIPTDDTSRSVIRLVLTLVEFVRQLLERQAVRRVREQTLTAEEIERLGRALMRLESTVHELAERHGLDRADLNLDLGPLGTLR